MYIDETEITRLIQYSEVNNMYDPDIIFDFFSRSNDTPYPGEGIGEKIKPLYKERYSDLSKIPNWRKKLSNFWVQPFIIDELKWASVEHYYQACRFKINNPGFYFMFSLNSNSDLSKDPAFAKKAAEKRATKYRGILVRDKSIKIDETFYNINNEIMFKAQYAKFTQNEDLRNLLLSTYDAKLNHTVIYSDRKSETEIFENLMIIRSIISNCNK